LEHDECLNVLKERVSELSMTVDELSRTVDKQNDVIWNFLNTLSDQVMPEHVELTDLNKRFKDYIKEDEKNG